MMAITTSNSIRVNPPSTFCGLLVRFGFWLQRFILLDYL